MCVCVPMCVHVCVFVCLTWENLSVEKIEARTHNMIIITEVKLIKVVHFCYSNTDKRILMIVLCPQYMV